MMRDIYTVTFALDAGTMPDTSVAADDDSDLLRQVQEFVDLHLGVGVVVELELPDFTDDPLGRAPGTATLHDVGTATVTWERRRHNDDAERLA